MAASKVKVNLTLDIREENLKAILYKLAADDISLKFLLENFISDLVYGIDSNGSDECDRVNAYYNRCIYGLSQNNTFLRYLLKSGEIDDFLLLLEKAEAYREWTEAGENYNQELAEVEKECDAFFVGWLSECDRPPQPKKEAYKQVKIWNKEHKEFIRNCEIVESEENI